ncbi:HAD-IA family hydrolase [Roseovarius rhodophyticola]|uniref:HAD-IA family hydrolase n=1 Tax=Roseovarius rhodophyticola TaxID=3080827 RepID=A0ABZ2TIP7_9RHOB|nr:HAD-IA family hydrolase [Roseovarius sp. W115]MDV2929828.1 HAD-IA family hydrolase [Roseovarius sp. W115]
MTDPLRLVIFDVDGTLVDSQGDIVAAMTAAFQDVDQPVPDRATILSIVGLSLDHAMARLAPDRSAATQARMVEGYKNAYVNLRAKTGAADSSPLYPGARDALEFFKRQDNLLLGVATGKSRRGLDKLLEAHDLEHMFVTQQVSDHHPSKPHPSMIETALAETGVETQNAVMVGDTSYDMDMALAAHVGAIGVGWGYHDVSLLSSADRIVSAFAELPDAVAGAWKVTAA